MFSAFKNRRPWAAAVLAFFFSPIVGMCYLGKGLWSIAYLLLVLPVIGLPPLVAHLGFLPLRAEPIIFVLALLYSVGGATHCYRLAKAAGDHRPEARFARWYVLTGLYFLIFVLPRDVLWEPYYIPSGAMEPTLEVGDNILVSNYAYRFFEPRRGDVVVFISPKDDETAYIKRLIGLPGDRVQMKAGSLYINGEQVPQAKTARAAVQKERDVGEVYRETLPEGRDYLILNLAENMPLDDTQVFEVPAGQYFFLGDNRDNSMDSRVAGRMGVVLRENLIGPVVLIYWNSEEQRLRLFDTTE